MAIENSQSASGAGSGPAAPQREIPLLGRAQAGLRNALAAAGAMGRTVAADARALGETAELAHAIRTCRSAFLAVGFFSFVLNVLMLAGPIFMLQVYDRVLASGSMPTLIALSLLTAAVYAIIGLLEMVRSRILTRVGTDLDRELGARVFDATLRQRLQGEAPSASTLRDLETLRTFLGGPGPAIFFDAPWAPLYLVFIFMFHWTMGVLALAGCILLFALAIASEVRTKVPLAEASRASARAGELAASGQRSVEVLAAMGMLGAYRARWAAANRQSLVQQALASDRLATLSAASKSLRLLLQSAMLAMGAALVIKSDLTAGSIIAGTIILGRALAPVEQAIGQWRTIVKAREAWLSLARLLTAVPPEPVRTRLPDPRGVLEVSNLSAAPPGHKKPVLNGVGFAVSPGQVLGIIGPSASGKSTLVRTLVGYWQPMGGDIRIDGAKLDQWDRDRLGRHVGYLPQDVELFSGSVRENIARFRTDATDEMVVEAARMAHAHDMILALPNGYDTLVGAFGAHLSGGQRQRLALARALFDRPALVVLDEPNSNLDGQGDIALLKAIDDMRARGQTVVLVTHRVNALGKVDLMLALEAGSVRAFGSRNEVLRALQAAGHGPQPAPAPAAPEGPAQALQTTLAGAFPPTGEAAGRAAQSGQQAAQRSDRPSSPAPARRQ